MSSLNNLSHHLRASSFQKHTNKSASNLCKEKIELHGDIKKSY